MDRYLYFLIFLILGFLIGASVFFTFIVAPLLFSHFNHRLAGEITNIIFPYYFGIGWILGIVIYTIIAILSTKNKEILRKLKYFVIGISIYIISSMALHKAILPIGQTLNSQYYQLLDEKKEPEAEQIKEKFKTIHSISSAINLFNIILLLFLFYNLYTTKKEEL
ncbi:hypothetical protein JCM14244_12440 [Venenivibrio stagnispumantis]|uniref:DUF4149 domain-containing protein n=1 Tax=Venenivibrio stagnispumantis TaxID=407998 RepID=UPI002236229C|nr:DUF4149 domain-containing protein [Venenivibrio stagnispumantis]MCW4573734.1 DUF4149 domain-containing protein [Venenivibrio stagnispumantis]